MKQRTVKINKKALKDYGFEGSLFTAENNIGENPSKDVSNISISDLFLEIVVSASGSAVVLFAFAAGFLSR